MGEHTHMTHDTNFFTIPFNFSTPLPNHFLQNNRMNHVALDFHGFETNKEAK